MVTPTMVIGLGGTGHKTVAQVRQQLLDVYGQVPPGVRLLTIDTTAAPDREKNLPDREFVSLNADLTPLVQAVKDAGELSTNKYSHIKSWLPVGELPNLASSAMFNLTGGTGGMRVLGRLALFSELSNPFSSPLMRILREAATETRRIGFQPTLEVVIVCSLAGGTGGGLLIDIAHLIHEIADAEGGIPNVHGYLAFPSTGTAGLPVARTAYQRRMQANTYAALRELARFAVLSPDRLAVPMYYTSGDGMLSLARRYCLVSPFENVYLFAHNHQDNSSPSTDESIARVIIAGLSEPERVKAAHRTKREVERRRVLANTSETMPDAGEVLLAAVELPMAQIAEAWASSLAADLLSRIVGTSTQVNEPLAEELSQLAASVEQWALSTTTLVDDSDNFLYPLRRVAQKEGLRSAHIESAVTNQYDLYKRSGDERAATELRDSVRHFLSNYIGSPSTTDRYTWGPYLRQSEDVVARYVEDVRSQLLDVIIRYLSEVGGGIGLRGIRIELNSLRSRWKAICDDCSQRERSTYEECAINWQHVDTYVLPPVRRGFFPKTGPADRYLEDCQRLLELGRQHMSAYAVLIGLQEIGALIEQLDDGIQDWISMFIDAQHSMTNQLHDERDKQARSGTITNGKDILLIRDPNWEQTKYDSWTRDTSALERMMAQIKWMVSLYTPQGAEQDSHSHNPTVLVSLRVGPDRQLLTAHIGPDPQLEPPNIRDAFVQLCEPLFAPLAKKLTLPAYLVETNLASSGNAVKQELAYRIATALKSEMQGFVPDMMPRLRLCHVTAPRGTDEQKDEVGAVMEELRASIETHLGLARNDSEWVESPDQLRMTTLLFQELIPLHDTVALRNSNDHYWRLTETERKWVHIFPAERHATPFEAVTHKALSPRVVNLLEDLGTMELFTSCWIYGRPEPRARLLYWNQPSLEQDQQGTGSWVLRWRWAPEEMDREGMSPGRVDELETYEPLAAGSLVEIYEILARQRLVRDQHDRGNLRAAFPNDANVAEILGQVEAADEQERLKSDRLGKRSPDIASKHIIEDGNKEASILLAQLDANAEAIARADALLQAAEPTGTILCTDDQDLLTVLTIELKSRRRELTNRWEQFNSLS